MDAGRVLAEHRNAVEEHREHQAILGTVGSLEPKQRLRRVGWGRNVRLLHQVTPWCRIQRSTPHGALARPFAEKNLRQMGEDDYDDRASAMRSSSCTTCGLALPAVRFMTCPTRNPITFSLPAWNCAT